MPELPEVETVVRALNKVLLNRTIVKIDVFQPSLRYKIDQNKLQNLCKKTIVAVKRRAKYIIIEMDDFSLLYVHLGMTGTCQVKDRALEIKKHEHVIFHLNCGSQLRYEDARRFGFIKYFYAQEKVPFIEHLAYEPLSDEFNSKYLFDVLQHKKQEIKKLIMDQRYVVGVGNIYASESLFLAGISPLKKANQVTMKKCKKLVSSIKDVLNQAILSGGTSIKDFRNVEGKLGYFFQQLKVYGRGEENCYTCNSSIKKIVQAQRATYYCPSCQK